LSLCLESDEIKGWAVVVEEEGGLDSALSVGVRRSSEMVGGSSAKDKRRAPSPAVPTFSTPSDDGEVRMPTPRSSEEPSAFTSSDMTKQLAFVRPFQMEDVES
jgi:hypothetical protein